jgi:hypothetical protein
MSCRWQRQKPSWMAWSFRSGDNELERLSHQAALTPAPRRPQAAPMAQAEKASGDERDSTAGVDR